MRSEQSDHKWDREEVVILVVEYFRSKDLSREEIIKSRQRVSFFLRKREEIRTGKTTSETFRNFAGITMQSGRINSLDPESRNFGMKATKLQTEIVQEYLHNPRKICDEADEIYRSYGRNIYLEPYMWCHKYEKVFQVAYEDKEIRRSLKSYSMYEKNEEHKAFMNILRNCLKEAYDSDLVINEYREIIDNNSISENEVANPSYDQVKDFSLDLILACIAWHFRRDHFVENSWINESVAYGHMYVLANVFIEKYENTYVQR